MKLVGEPHPASKGFLKPIRVTRVKIQARFHYPRGRDGSLAGHEDSRLEPGASLQELAALPVRPDPEGESSLARGDTLRAPPSTS